MNEYQQQAECSITDDQKSIALLNVRDLQSKCCQSSFAVACSIDDTAHWYECIECDYPCDIEPVL